MWPVSVHYVAFGEMAVVVDGDRHPLSRRRERAVLSVLLWVPSFVALLFARRVISSGSFARGFGA